jgi:hypothetical protein
VRPGEVYPFPAAMASRTPVITKSSPKLECDQTVYDFGTVNGGKAVSHTFQIRNAGNSELVIRKIHAPCRCTSFLLSNKTLPPGEMFSIPLTVSLGGRKGLQEKGVFLETNDPATPALQLTLRGVVGSGIWGMISLSIQSRFLWRQ